MAVHPRSVLIATAAAAAVVFCAVQNRVTGEGVHDYVTHQQAALAANEAPIRIDSIMKPAVDRSVKAGLEWGGAVLVGGTALASVVARRSR